MKYKQFKIENMKDRSLLMTEKDNENSYNLDLLDTEELVALFSNEDTKPQEAVSKASSEIIKAIDLITNRINKKGRLIYIGAGTSGRLGVLDASECPPTFCSSPELVQALIAGGDKSLRTSSESLEDNVKTSIEDLQYINFNSKDSLVGITAGGTTPYVLSALKYARKIKALSIAISCVPKSDAFIDCDLHIRLLTGPELLTGSTRLKAGTATKMTLNIISTSVMIKLGKVYHNKMVDVSATNSKLIDRSIRIIQDLTDNNRQKSLELLELAEGSVKLALLISISGMNVIKARQLLRESDDNLRLALNKFDSD